MEPSVCRRRCRAKGCRGGRRGRAAAGTSTYWRLAALATCWATWLLAAPGSPQQPPAGGPRPGVRAPRRARAERVVRGYVARNGHWQPPYVAGNRYCSPARRCRLRSTTAPAPPTAVTQSIFFARSIPAGATFSMVRSLLAKKNRHSDLRRLRNDAEPTINRK